MISETKIHGAIVSSDQWVFLYLELKDDTGTVYAVSDSPIHFNTPENIDLLPLLVANWVIQS
jgi:hypothetical protein